MVSVRIGSGRTSAPRPAQADSISACMRAESKGTRTPRSVTISTGATTARRARPARALLRTPLAVEHVGARDLVVAAAHQAELDLVLHVLDMKRAAARTRAQQAADDGLGQLVDGLADARRGGTLRAVDGEKRLHQRDRDLVRLERDDGAVAAKDLVALVRRCGGAGRVGVRVDAGATVVAWAVVACMKSPLEPWRSGAAGRLVACAGVAADVRTSHRVRHRDAGRDFVESKSGYRGGHYIWGLDAQQPLHIASNP